MQFWVYFGREAWGEFGKGGGGEEAKRAEAYVKVGSSTVLELHRTFTTVYTHRELIRGPAFVRGLDFEVQTAKINCTTNLPQ